MARLLLLCEYPTLNGGEQSMLATLGDVVEAGFVPIVAAPPEGPLAQTLRARGVEVIAFETSDAAGRRRPQAELRQRLAECVRAIRPDLLHANSLAMGRLSGPVAAELCVPSIAHLRDIVKLGPQAVADLNCHTRLLAVSHATRQFHVDQGLVPEKTCVQYNGVDRELFFPRPATGYLHRALGLPPEAPLVGTIGQISLRKGQDVLVQAIERLVDRTDARFLVVGERFSDKAESREFEAAIRRAAEGPLAGRLFFLGIREDVDRLINEWTLLVHPARQEPLGRVLLEAGAAGLPVIATDVGGTREIFPPESHAARLVPPDDPGSLAQAIEELLGDAAEQYRLATAARQRIAEVFDRRLAAAGLLRHYQEVTPAASQRR